MMATLSITRGHISLQVVDQIVYSVCNVMTNILVARLIGPASYGQYFAIWAFIFFLVELQMVFVDSPLLTIGPTYTDEVESRHYFAGLLMVEAVWLFIGFGLITVWVLLFYHLSLQLALLFGLTAALFMAQRVLRRFFQYERQAKPLLIMDFLSSGGQIAVLVLGLCLLHHLNLNQVLIISLFTTLIGVFVITPHFSKWPLTLESLKMAVRRNLVLITWYPLWNLLNMGYMQNMFKTIGTQLGKSTLGGLGVVQITMQPILALMMNYYTIYTPIFIHQYHDADKKPNQWITFYRHYGILFLICVIYIAFVSYFARPIIEFFWGAAFLPYTRFVVWQGIWALLQLLCNGTGIYFFLIERPRFRTLYGLGVILIAWGAFTMFAWQGLKDLMPYFISQYVYLALQLIMQIPLFWKLSHLKPAMNPIKANDL